MPGKENDTPPKRQYPAFYEKAVPIALVVIVLGLVVLLLIVLAVFAGLLPAGG